MDSNINLDKNPSLFEANNDELLSEVQINPLSLMTSIASYKPVDDNQENVLETTAVNRSQSTDVTTSLSDQNDQQKPSVTTRMDENSVAAWVQSTTHESTASPIERSPSLPATIIEQITTRSRRESTVSTLCDSSQQQQQQQQGQLSTISDTLSSTISQNLSGTTDYQRSFSFPLVDQNEINNKKNHEDDIRFLSNDNDEDFAGEFLPVQESEESEIDKAGKLTDDSPLEPNRSPPDDQTKKYSNVSFHASVSFNPQTKPSLSPRQRHNSWNKGKVKPSTYNRSQSQKTSSHQHSQKSYQTSASVPTDPNQFVSDMKTNQSSSLSDNVFLSTSTTNSHSSSHCLALINRQTPSKQFLSLPSSTSIWSSERLTSNISDISGQSGIESNNLRTSASEPPFTSSITEEDTRDSGNRFFSKPRTNSVTSDSSRTASTESLTSMTSEDEMNDLTNKFNMLNQPTKAPQTPTQQRLHIVKQLMWLLEKRPTINPRYNLIRAKPPRTSPVEFEILFIFLFQILTSSRFVHHHFAYPMH